MYNLCPVFKDNYCLVKKYFKKEFSEKIFNLEVNSEKYTKNCQGNIENCCFKSENKVIEETPVNDTVLKQEDNIVVAQEKTEVAKTNTKISIHVYENPYLIKSDVLVYPINNILTIDDPLLHRMSKGVIQQELDKFSKPIKMGNVYITTNGGENSKIQSKYVYHAVVAGESRLVNEDDIKSSTRKSLLLANENNVRNIVFLPPDCGTLDINDTARVHLSAIKTFLQLNKSCNIKNIFIVMSDKDSYDVYENYYKRIFK